MDINEFLYELENPQVYTGREINAVRKPVEDIRGGRLINVCLVFPDTYEIGMSHQGLLMLYHMLNRMKGVNAERCFLPGKPSIAVFKEKRVPLFSLESKTFLKDFDVIGFSLLSEMNYTNVLQILDLAQVPLKSGEREEGGPYPLIAAGGISAVNPEPLRQFIDFFGIGDGEDIFPDIIEVLAEARVSSPGRPGRGDLLRRLDRIESIYVPGLHPPVQRGRFYVPDLEPGAIKKRVIRKLDECPTGPGDSTPDYSTIVPITNVVFDRLTVEIARGCPQNCRFCQAKSYYAPYRTRSLERNMQTIQGGLKATGFESFSLSSLSAGDYPQLTPMLESIPGVIPPGVSFSLPSLRPSTLSHHLLSTIALFKRTGITIVPEAGTARLRRVINKDVTDEEIYNAVELALNNKWQKIKLYFMLGLPTETMEDIDGIVHMIKEIHALARAAKRKIKIHASFSPFVPKPHTPLQWAKRESPDVLMDRVSTIKQQLKTISHRFLDLDFHRPYNSIVETIMARGDYRAGELLLEAFQKGEIFSAWDHDFNFPVWEEKIKGSVYEEFLTEFSPDEALPWDFLLVNFTKEYLKTEYRNALEAVPTPSCNQLDCKTCRGCAFKMERGTEPPDRNSVEPAVETKENIPPVTYNKVRLFYEKSGDFIHFSHLSMAKYVERLIRRGGILFRCTEGFTPRMKLITLPALPVFATGLEEVVEVFLDASLSEEQILERLNQSAAPEGFRFKKVMECSAAPLLSKDVSYLEFDIMVDGLPELLPGISALLAETDSLGVSGNVLTLHMDYGRQGQERFAKIYRLIDPDKKRTMFLTRKAVTFRSEEDKRLRG
jgi:radical SAM family uncharacterized protein